MARKKAKKVASQQTDAQGGIVGKIHELRTFFEESKVEIKKVVWPSRKETVSTCVAVVVVTLVIALYLGVVDLGLSKLVALILS